MTKERFEYRRGYDDIIKYLNENFINEKDMKIMAEVFDSY
jgi:hypothetical protein